MVGSKSGSNRGQYFVDNTAKVGMLFLWAQTSGARCDNLRGVRNKYGLKETAYFGAISPYCVRFIFMDTYITKSGKRYKVYRFASLERAQRVFVSFAALKCLNSGGINIPITLQDTEHVERVIYCRLETENLLLIVVWDNSTQAELARGAVEL